jgi:murein DD-endopeptidase MepM/ murein hydrolase activator NlpD
MKRLLSSLAVLVVALGGAAAAADASSPVFTVVPSAPTMTPLASAETPNSGGLALPPAYLSRRESAGLPFPALHGLWQKAGATYGIPWQVLAAINKVESNFGRNMGPSSAGAIGWMQFMPSTWLRWGMDADGDGVADPWNPPDAIYSAARYLAAAGGRTDISRGIFAYNHAQWYVDEILGLARLYGQNGVDMPFTYDRLQVNLQAAERTIAKQNRVVVHATLEERRLARRSNVMYAKADAALLLSNRLTLQKRAFQVDARRAAAAATVVAAKRKLKAAEAKLEKARSSALTSSFAPGGASLLAAPLYQGDYVFPVGGGPSVVSVGHHHHDYPAADIAAPEGAPLYALTDGFIVDAWHMPNGNCGIGLTLRSALDGREWTYCHMSYEEPGIQAGVAVSAGQPVGLVGSTGHSSGPHLHLQLQPASSYPQVEPWFGAFAGSAFRWQDAPTVNVGPVFQVVDGGSDAPSDDPDAASDDPDVITFTVERS